MFGAYIRHVGLTVEPLTYSLFQDAIALAVEDAQLVLAEQSGVVEKMLQIVDGLVDPLAADVQLGREGLAFFVDVVEDALEAALAATALVARQMFLGRRRQSVQCNGHAHAVAFHHRLFAAYLHHLSEGLLTVDAHDGAHLDGKAGVQLFDLGFGSGGQGLHLHCTTEFVVVAFLLRGKTFRLLLQPLSRLLGLLFLGL